MTAHIWEVGVVQHWDGQDMVNVIHVLDGSGVQDADTIAGVVSDAWVATNSIADVVQTTDISYKQLNCRDITANAAGVEIDWPNGTTTGQINEETTPPSVAVCFTVKSTQAGRSKRGRMYISGVRHSLYSSLKTRWDLGGSAGIEVSGAGEAFRSALDSGGCPLQIYSRLHSSYVAAFTVLPHSGLASQRRRANRYATP